MGSRVSQNTTGDVEFVEDLKHQWMAMIDAIDDPLVIIDSDYTIHRQNRSYFEHGERTQGRSIRELRGLKCYEVFAGRSSPCKHCQLPKALREGKSVSWSTNVLKPEREIEVRVRPLMGEEGRSVSLPPAPQRDDDDEISARSPRVGRAGGLQRIVVHYRDVTEMRGLQENLARSDKLAALGKLAGGVAHEINSPLAGILAFAQMVQREMAEDNPHKQDMEEIAEAARKCKTIVEQLLGFARQEKPTEHQTFDVNETVRSTLRLANALLRKHHIDVQLDLGESPAWVAGSAGKIGQVVLNLVTNALYAMKECGGTLVVRSRSEDGAVYLSVEDSGTGIDPSHLKKIFDPFFTTKPVGEGTGLGLSISYSIVKQHGGNIQVQSSPGLGTTFIIELPLRSEEKAS